MSGAVGPDGMIGRGKTSSPTRRPNGVPVTCVAQRRRAGELRRRSVPRTYRYPLWGSISRRGRVIQSLNGGHSAEAFRGPTPFLLWDNTRPRADLQSGNPRSFRLGQRHRGVHRIVRTTHAPGSSSRAGHLRRPLPQSVTVCLPDAPYGASQIVGAAKISWRQEKQCRRPTRR